MTHAEDLHRVSQTGEHEMFFVEERDGQRTTVTFYGRSAWERLVRFLRGWRR